MKRKQTFRKHLSNKNVNKVRQHDVREGSGREVRRKVGALAKVTRDRDVNHTDVL